MRLKITIFFICLNFLYANGGLLKVDWSKIDTNQQKTRVLPKVLKDGIKNVTLPVYMPRYYIYERNISIVSDANFYAITVELDRATLMISGDRTYQEKVISKSTKLKTKIESITDKFIKAEGIISVDFHRNGVNYSLSLECDAPDIDPRCTDDRFLKKIYNGLVLIGGKR